MTRKPPPEACMFCDLGDCETHAPKPAKVKSNKRSPVADVRPVAAGGGTARSTHVSPLPPAAVANKAVRALQQADTDGDEVMRQAIVHLLPLLDHRQVRERRHFIGPEAERYIRLGEWKEKVSDDQGQPPGEL